MFLSHRDQHSNGAARAVTPLLVVCMLLLVSCGSGLSDVFVGPDVEGLSVKTTEAILKAQELLTKNPKDSKIAFALAGQYLQAVRESADTAYYDRVEKLLLYVDRKDPGNPETPFLRGQIAMGRHHFAEALPIAEKLTADYPNVQRYYGLLGDAQIEMGKYTEAVQSLQTMADIRPDTTTLTRIAYAREIHGDFPGAVEAMRFVVDELSPIPENAAWSLCELGRLLLPVDVNDARRQYEHALAIYPDFAPALAGLARISMEEGNPKAGLEYAQKAFDALPLPEYSTLLADVRRARGEIDQAKAQELLTDAGYDAIAKRGVSVDLERAKFLVEHDRNLALAENLAQAVFTVRPTIYAADVVAFSQLKNGRPEEAWMTMQQALRTNTKDPLILYHAALIADAVGKTAEANMYVKEVLQRPHFSFLLEPEVKNLQAKLSASR